MGWLKLINKGQRGLTLTELILALCITIIITAVITLTVFQVLAGSVRTKNHMTAIRQVQSAGYWVSHDAQMAQDVSLTPNPDPDGFPLALSWTEWGGTVNDVTYTLNGTELIRSHNGQQNPVAEFINPDLTNCVWDGSLLTLTVTATVGEQSETRIYEVMPRPGS